MVLTLLQQHGDVILKHVPMAQGDFTVLYHTALNVPPAVQASAALAHQHELSKLALTLFFSAT